MRTIRETPRHEKVVLTRTREGDDECLMVRHPWVDGVTIKLGIRKLDSKARVTWRRLLEDLLDAHPIRPEDCTLVLPDRIRRAYFDPLTLTPAEVLSEYDTPERALTTRDRIRDEKFPAGERRPITLGDMTLLSSPERLLPHTLALELAGYKSELARALARVRTLERQNSELMAALGERPGAELAITLSECMKVFTENYQPRRGSHPKTRAATIRRAQCFISSVGEGTHIGSLTVTGVQAVIDGWPCSDREKSHKAAAIKTFFSWLCRTTVDGGMGLRVNPVKTLTYASASDIADRRRAAGLVREAEKPEMTIRKLPEKWRAFYAVLAYAGLRTSECAALRWKDVDDRRRVISILPNEDYGKRKSRISVRAVPPFRELWKWLKKPRGTRPDDRIFSRPDGESWFNVDGWATQAGDALVDAMKSVGIADTAEPARRTRRYWVTRMNANGLNSYVQQFGGHTPSVSERHYNNSLTAARGLAKRL